MIFNFLVALNAILGKGKIKLPGVVKLVATAIKLAAEAKLKDGTVIYTTADAWDKGVDAYTKDAEGNPVPLTPGSYELEDGSTVVIGDDMLVAEVTAKSDDTPPADAELSVEQLQAIATETANALVAETNAHTATKAELTTANTNLAAVKLELKNEKAKLVALSNSVKTGKLNEDAIKLANQESKPASTKDRILGSMDAATV